MNGKISDTASYFLTSQVRCWVSKSVLYFRLDWLILWYNILLRLRLLFCLMPPKSGGISLAALFFSKFPFRLIWYNSQKLADWTCLLLHLTQRKTQNKNSWIPNPTLANSKENFFITKWGFTYSKSMLPENMMTSHIESDWQNDSNRKEIITLSCQEGGLSLIFKKNKSMPMLHSVCPHTKFTLPCF